MHEITVICPFCGQMLLVRVPEETAESELYEIAAENCSCDSAKKYSDMKRRKMIAKKRIENLFDAQDKVHPDIITFLNCIIDAVADEKVKRVGLNLGSGISVNISLTSSNTIKVQKTVKNQTGFEE